MIATQCFLFFCNKCQETYNYKYTQVFKINEDHVNKKVDKDYDFEIRTFAFIRN